MKTKNLLKKAFLLLALMGGQLLRGPLMLLWVEH